MFNFKILLIISCITVSALSQAPEYVKIEQNLSTTAATCKDSLIVVNVTIKIEYNNNGSGTLIKKDYKCDSSCTRINQLNVELTDFDYTYWQNLLQFIKHDKYPNLIPNFMCGGPVFTWKITLFLKNDKTVTLYETDEIINSHIVHIIGDNKFNGHLELDEKTHENFRLRLLRMLKRGFQFNDKEIDCGC